VLPVLNKAIRLVERQIKHAEAQTLLVRPFSIDEPQFYWTGKKVDFVESAYALYLVRCINNGKISLKELIQVLGKTFHIEIRDDEYSRIFTDIINRKGNNATFTYSLWQAVNRRVEELILKPPRK
jgi:hypothetical protein